MCESLDESREKILKLPLKSDVTKPGSDPIPQRPPCNVVKHAQLICPFDLLVPKSHTYFTPFSIVPDSFELNVPAFTLLPEYPPTA